MKTTKISDERRAALEDQVFDELVTVRDAMRMARGEFGEEIDVRVQWHGGEKIFFHSGDSCYDTNHSGWWGSELVTGHEDYTRLKELAAELVEEVVNARAECAEDES